MSNSELYVHIFLYLYVYPWANAIHRELEMFITINFEVNLEFANEMQWFYAYSCITECWTTNFLDNNISSWLQQLKIIEFLVSNIMMLLKRYIWYKIYMHLRSYDQDIQIVYVKQSNRTINKFCIHGNEVNFKIKLTVRILYLNR